MMQAAFLEAPGHLIVREAPVPEPGAGAVVIRVRAATTCGTDLKAYTRGHPKIPMPTRFGHEYAGEIVAVGAEVRGWAEGDAVMGVQTGPCGACYWCRREQEELCPQAMERAVWGAYAEYLELPAHIVRRNLHPKPPELPFEEACIMEPLACVLRGLRALTLRSDDTVLIVGAGPIALLQVIALRAAGLEEITVSGRHAARLAVAAALGATASDADETPPAQLVQEVTAGLGFDVVIECTGQPAVWTQSVQWVRRGGQVCLFGGCPGGTTVTWDTGRLHYDEVRVVSPFHLTPRDVRAARELLIRESGPAGPFRRLLTAAAPLADLPQVFERLRAGEGVKYVIYP